MKENEYHVQCARAGVAECESRLRELENDLESGLRIHMAKVAQAVADKEKEQGRLKEEIRRAEVQLGRQKAYLQFKEAELEKGFSE